MATRKKKTGAALDNAIKREREKLAKINKAVRDKKAVEKKAKTLLALKKKVSTAASKAKKLKVVHKRKAA
jgi:hypothetical protein